MSKDTQLLNHAFVLHTRQYRESSVIVEFFTLEQGRLSAMARGAKRPKSQTRALLQPFLPLRVSFGGRGDLATLTHIEMQHSDLSLQGRGVIYGFYLNELLMRVLLPAEEMPSLFEAYQQTLLGLAAELTVEPLLRYFELQLLQELGYGLDLEYDVDNHPITAEHHYHFDGKGHFIFTESVQSKDHYVFEGESLVQLRQQQLAQGQALRDCKVLMRLALAPLLGTKPLKTRELL